MSCLRCFRHLVVLVVQLISMKLESQRPDKLLNFFGFSVEPRPRMLIQLFDPSIRQRQGLAFTDGKTQSCLLLVFDRPNLSNVRGVPLRF